MVNLNEIKHVLIGGTNYDIEGSTMASMNEIREAAVEIDPALANADMVVNGDTVEFRFKAGIKGATITKVVYNNNEYAVDTNMYSDPKDIKDALVEMFPELANAEYVINDDTMTFRFKAGTKGVA